MDKLLMTAMEIGSIMDSVVDRAIDEIDSESILSADQSDLEIAKLTIQMKDAIKTYLEEQANCIAEINVKLDMLLAKD